MVNKDARDWTQNYFNEKLVGIGAEEDGVSAKITKVLSVEGDVDVSQRKGKVITIFDVNVKLEYDGKNADELAGSGSINIPEVAHDTEKDEYVFEISNYSDSKEKQPIRDLVRSKIVPQLREAFSKFGPALIEQHGSDIQHTANNDPKQGSPQPAAATTTKAASAKPVETVRKTAHVVNTVKISETYEFQTSAEQLYQTFIDPQRVAAFTRNPPREFEPKEGGKFSLFGGNVEGVFRALEKEKKIAQDWRLADWPKGHYSTLTLEFDQGTDSTNLRITWDGVPVGQEEVTRRNFGEYYVRSIKTTFGYGKSFPIVRVESSLREKVEVFAPVLASVVLVLMLAGAFMYTTKA